MLMVKQCTLKNNNTIPFHIQNKSEGMFIADEFLFVGGKKLASFK